MTQPAADIAAIELASLLCSRLCHDLLSPVGALNNGLELLADEKDPEMRARCFELLELSARASADKLKFYRLAFGAAGGFADLVPLDEARSLALALVGTNERVTLDWAPGGPPLPKPAIKVLLNLILVGFEALVRGGTLMVAAEARGSDTEIAVRSTGPKVVFDAAIGRALQGRLEPGELASRNAAAHLVHLVASAHGGEVLVAHDGESLTLGALLAGGGSQG